MLFEKLSYAEGFPMNIKVSKLVEDPIHYHTDNELVYVLKGEIQLKNGYCIYHLREGDVFANSGNEVHSMKALTDDNIVVQIHISTRDMSQYFPNLSKSCYRTYSKKPTDKKYNRLKELLLQLLMKYEQKGFNYKSECIYLLVDLIKHLDKYFNLFAFDKDVVVGFDRGNQLMTDRISRICQFIYQNYASNITLQDLSDMEYLNSFYLSHLIKDSTGMNFREFLCFARVEMSEIGLLSTDKKISQIASEVGFSTTAYYKKYFTKWFGHSPQEHRAIYLPEVKSDLRPAIFEELSPSRAVAIIKQANSRFNTSTNTEPIVTSLNLDVNVDVTAPALHKLDCSLHLVITPEDCRVLGSGISEILAGLAPEKVILLDDEDWESAEIHKIYSLLLDSGCQVEVRKDVERDMRHSAAFDSIIYPINVLKKQFNEKGKSTVQLFLRDTDSPEGRILQGQLSPLTSNGLKKPAYYAYEALSCCGGDVIAQGNQYCVIRSTNKDETFFTIFAYNCNNTLQSICQRDANQTEVKNAIHSFRDELNININFNLKPGTYSVVKYTMAKEDNIFAHLSALNFRDEILSRYNRFNFFSGSPAVDTYLDDVRTVFNIIFSLQGAGVQMAVICHHTNR